MFSLTTFGRKGLNPRQAAWILAVAVSVIAGFAWWTWSTRRAVERASTVFLTALIQGDRETLLERMDGPAREAFLAKSPKELEADFAPIPGALGKIREVHLSGNSARVRVRFEVSGFDIWSDFLLRKSDQGDWKITELHQPNMIPTWEQVRKKIAEDAEPPSHQVLSEKLNGQEGVEVRPLEPGELGR